MLRRAHSRPRRVLTLLLGIAVAAGLLSGFTLVPAEQATASPPASAFDPGEIISDSIFYDFGTMSVGDIQSFLDSKVSSCSSSSPAPCLKDYKDDIRSVAGIKDRCDNDIKADSNATAARIIYVVARACEVNPQTLLVTLQKEQGLVTRTSVSSLIYRKAMGYGCPDTAECASAYYGFFNQVYWAARAFNSYANFPSSFPAYQPGKRSIQYTTKSSCGSKTVTVRNKATTALYTYTPYTPNSAALNNPYAVGDSCSAYGNRNFWLYFNDWFGDTRGGSFLLRSSSAHDYFISGTKRYEIPQDQPGLLSSLVKAYGKVGTVSSDYLSSFTSSGKLSRVIRSGSKLANGEYRHMLLDGGKLYNFASCADVTAFGFTCNSGPIFTADQLAPFTQTVLSKNWGNHITTSAGSWMVDKGKKREIADAKSVTDAGVALDPAVAMTVETIAQVPYGEPIVSANRLITSRAGGDRFLTTTDGAFRIDSTLVAQTGLSRWLGTTSGVLDSGSISKLTPVKPFPAIFSEASGKSYVLVASGKVRLSDPAEWSSSIPVLDPKVAASIPDTGASYTAPRFFTSLTAGYLYYLSGGERRAVSSQSDLALIAKSTGAPTAAPNLPSASIKAIADGGPMVPAATVVRTSSSTQKWLIDGLGSRVAITNAYLDQLVGNRTVRTVSQATLASYQPSTVAMTYGATCGSKKYITVNGILRPISSTDATEYGAKFGFRPYDADTCALLTRYTTTMGTLIKTPTTYYIVEDGTRRALSSAQYKAASKAAGRTALSVPSAFAALLPAAPEKLDAGEVVSATGSGTKYLIDGTGARVKASRAQLTEIVGTYTVRSVQQAALTSRPIVAAKLGAKCGSLVYLTAGGRLYRVSSASANEYRPGLNFRLYSEATCKTFSVSTKTAGTLLKVGSTYYSVADGKKKKLTSAQYESLRASTGHSALPVSSYFAGLLG